MDFDNNLIVQTTNVSLFPFRRQGEEGANVQKRVNVIIEKKNENV